MHFAFLTNELRPLISQQNEWLEGPLRGDILLVQEIIITKTKVLETQMSYLCFSLQC